MFSFINIFGLALSMSVCMLVLLRIKDQLSYDRFHPHQNRIYRLTTVLHNKDGDQYHLASTPLPLAETLKKDYSVLDQSVRLSPAGGQVMTTGAKELTVNCAFADSSFFDLFGFTLARGKAHNALAAPNSIVLTQETADKFFNGFDPIGKVLNSEKLGNLLVTGVLKKTGKSHINFNAYISMASVPYLEKTGKISKVLDQWNNINAGYTYVRVKKSVNEKQLAIVAEQASLSLMKQSSLNGKEKLMFQVQPLSKIILGKDLLYSIGNTGSRGKVLAEIGISLIILLSACFNYTNLSIARSLSRGKEVGIRKVSGARRLQVFNQFVIESLIISLFALGLAHVLLKLIIDFAPFSGEMVPPGFQFDLLIFFWFFLFSLFSGLLAGVLPAWALSSFNPVQVLKNLSTVKLFGGNGFRKGLIITQFTLCLIITVFTTVFSRQFTYMATADPGFNRDNVLSITLDGADSRILAVEINNISGVQKVGATSGNLGVNTTGHISVKTKPGTQAVGVDYFDVNSDFIHVMDLKILAGRTFFSKNDTQKEEYVIMNESAIKSLRFQTPLEAVDQTVWLQDSVAVQICGVVKDFYYQGLEQPVTPLILRNRSDHFKYLTVKTVSDHSAILENIKEVWKKHQPEYVFEGQWLKDILYKKRSAWSTVSMLGFLSFMAITIACVGLLGMVIYTMETRRKEIGIRKVMGASVSAIITLLSKGFIKLIIVAGLIALPVSYLLGYFFLSLFANRINLGIGSLMICFLGLFFLVLIVIGSQIYKVAIANPIHSLRTEQ